MEFNYSIEKNNTEDLNKKILLLEDRIVKLESLQTKRYNKVINLGLLNLIIKSFTLCIFSVILFLSANNYQDITLWGIGVCLIIFVIADIIDSEGIRKLW